MQPPSRGVGFDRTRLSMEIFSRNPLISLSICSSCLRNTKPASGSALTRLLSWSLRGLDGRWMVERQRRERGEVTAGGVVDVNVQGVAHRLPCPFFHDMAAGGLNA